MSLTVDACESLDINRLNREGCLRPGSRYRWTWSSGSWIELAAGPNGVEFVYRSREPGGEWESARYTVRLARTRCNFAGERPWFVCPACDRRAGKLYLAGRLYVGGLLGFFFACRRCHGLTYESQLEDRGERLLRKAQTIRVRRLGGSPVDPFPPKPKGMHWRTYDRLCERALAADDASLDFVLSRFGARVGRGAT